MMRAPRDFAMTANLRVLLRKDAAAHKYTHGHALVVAGGAGRTGAARLTARGALRAGAGLVTLAVPEDALLEVACQITAVMMRKMEGAESLGALLADDRINALGLGPGMGVGDTQASVLAAALAATRATVLDADALTLLSQDPALRNALHPATILTPHDGEFARLFPDLSEGIASHPTEVRAKALHAASMRMGCTIILKGPETLVAGPDGPVWIHRQAADGGLAWLATAGSGDVLAGFVLGLLARSVAPVLAANLAVCLHGLAARRFGPGLIAEDLPDQLPGVFADLGV